MSKITGLLVGLAVGAALGTLLVALFAPASGKTLIHALKEGYRETLLEAQKAGVARRRELEAELRRLKGKP